MNPKNYKAIRDSSMRHIADEQGAGGSGVPPAPLFFLAILAQQDGRKTRNSRSGEKWLSSHVSCVDVPGWQQNGRDAAGRSRKLRGCHPRRDCGRALDRTAVVEPSASPAKGKPDPASAPVPCGGKPSHVLPLTTWSVTHFRLMPYHSNRDSLREPWDRNISDRSGRLSIP